MPAAAAFCMGVVVPVIMAVVMRMIVGASGMGVNCRSMIMTAASAILMRVVVAVIMRGLMVMPGTGAVVMAVFVAVVMSRFVLMLMIMGTTARSGAFLGKKGNGLLTDEPCRMQGTAGACYCCVTHGFLPVYDDQLKGVIAC